MERELGGAAQSRARRLAHAGLVRIEDELAGAKVSTKTERHLRLVADPEDAAVRGKKQKAVLDVLRARLDEGEETVRQADVLEEAEAGAGTVRSLAENGWVLVEEREVVRDPFGEMPRPAADHALHPAQAAALEAITGALGAGEAKTFLLHGATGSGKTEVYIQALKKTLAAGRTGIVLVPEIALTPQTVRRFRAHFGDRVAVLHSRLSAGERYDQWRQLRSGRYRVVIGPRSAVLAPLSDVGLIVVDEEHEASYKQFDPAPRYHARDVAVMRAHLDGAVCVLGSATPSLESVLNARAGKYHLLPMPNRVPVPGLDAAPLPPVTIVDLGWEHRVRRLRGALSHPLREAIQARLDRGEQTILLQNRRGFAPVTTCDDCGWSPRCPNCAVTLTLHRPRGRRAEGLRCHYCGFAQRRPYACPRCESTAIAEIGAGTQRVEEELAEVFPRALVLRMDLDTTTRKDAHRTLLDSFGKGDADILVGTQMVAKGLDFERVTLVGVVDADTGLLLPDFRAAERTFQLLMQVAGRAGRGRFAGEVFFQTRSPDHPAVQFAAGHDFGGFAKAELPDRHALDYPPFGRLVSIEFKGPDPQAVERLANAWTLQLEKQAPGYQVLGPEPAFLARVKRQYRYRTLVKAGRGVGPYALPALVRAVQAAYGPPPKGCRVNVDVDPVGLL